MSKTTTRRQKGTESASADTSVDMANRRRAYWHSLALDRAKGDCCVLDLIPWEGRELRRLPDEIYHPLLRQIDELVTGVCAREVELQNRPTWLQDRFTLAIWDFLKPWSKNPNVPRGTGTTQQNLFGGTS